MIVMKSITFLIRIGFSRKHQATHVCQHNGGPCCFIVAGDICCVADRWQQQSCIAINGKIDASNFFS
ncbi:hypothetical protein CKQ90_04310 [Klebsiella pneumoniae]|nr:hypothetical protein CKQ90_04310 [Klebsiella pneumoniae]